MLRTKKPRRHVSCLRRTERPVAVGVDESWSMDFMTDELFDGRRIRLLTIVDNFSRESLAIRLIRASGGQDQGGSGGGGAAKADGAAPAAQNHPSG